MPNVLIICAHRPNRSPSQRYRFEQYLPLLTAKGFNFTWSYLLNEKDDKLFYSSGNFLLKIKIVFKTLLIRIKDCFKFKQFDIIFIQREAHFLGISFFEKKAYKSSAKVIFDFDDSIWLNDTSPENKIFSFLKNPNKFYKNIKHAHLVIAGNNFLANESKKINLNTIVIPTTVNTNYNFPITKNTFNTIVTIGWSGSISTIKHFESLIPVLTRLKNKYKTKIKFCLISQTKYLNKELEIESHIWSVENENKLLNTFDIGIMPLPNNIWTKGKCGLKGLTYMACNIATVMSNVGVNNEIIENGVNGFLCSTDEEWFSTLCLLIEYKQLRFLIAEKGLQTVEQKYSTRANEQAYLNAFKNALNN
ncbi:MAG: glycosyltransferase family 4 protein [Bacteroidia bacterium]|jgi:glycosyltransferase involved in cell wall biosynthesis